MKNISKFEKEKLSHLLECTEKELDALMDSLTAMDLQEDNSKSGD